MPKGFSNQVDEFSSLILRHLLDTRSDYRSSAQTYQTYLNRGEDGAASTLKEVFNRNRFTAITGCIIILILIAIFIFVIALFYYLSRTNNTPNHSTVSPQTRGQPRRDRIANSFLRYKLMIPGRRRNKRQKAQS